MIAIRGEIDRVAGGGVDGRGHPAARRAAHRGRRSPASGTAPTRVTSRCSRPAATPTSTGRRSAASTRPTATATWSAPARRRRRSPARRRVSAPVAGLTARRLDVLLAQEQVRGRLPSIVGGLVRDGALVWTGSVSALDGLRDRAGRAVPDRLDHQDAGRGAGPAAARRGAARPQRPARRAPARHRVRRPHAARPAGALDRHARRARRRVVGAQPGRRVRRAGRGARRLGAGVRGRAHLPLHERRLRAARRGRRPAPGLVVVGAGASADPASRWG